MSIVAEGFSISALCDNPVVVHPNADFRGRAEFFGADKRETYEDMEARGWIRRGELTFCSALCCEAYDAKQAV